MIRQIRPHGRDVDGRLAVEVALAGEASGDGAQRESHARVTGGEKDTFGAGRLDVPDLELYGLAKAQVPAAVDAVRHVHDQLLDRGLKAELSLPTGEPVYLVPVLEAWQHLSPDWPGVGRAGQDRGPGLDGPRATLSILKQARFGRYKKDFSGVLKAL